MTQRQTNWESLVSKASEESVATLDVTTSVMQRIASISSPAMADWTIRSAAGLSVAAALLMILAVPAAGISWNDPFGDWFSSLFLVMS